MLDARQLAEVYAFARIEPLDEPLQRMLAELTATIARVHGNDLPASDFMLVRDVKLADPQSDAALRTQQITQMFARASRANAPKKEKTRPKR